MGISPKYQRVKALCDSRLAWESRPSIKGLKPCVTHLIDRPVMGELPYRVTLLACESK